MTEYQETEIQDLFKRIKFHTPKEESTAKCKTCEGKIKRNGLKCTECTQYSHVTCTGLSNDTLCHFYSSGHQYVCNECIRKKYELTEKHFKVIDYFKKLERSEILGGDESFSLYQTADTDCPEAPPTETPSVGTTGETNSAGGETIATSGNPTLATEITAQIETNLLNPHSSTPKKATNLEKSKPKPLRNAPTKALSTKRVCWFMKNKGKCRFGEKCKYKHPELCSTFIRNGSCTTELCNLLHPSLCKYGDDCEKPIGRCNFMHIKKKAEIGETCPKQRENTECNDKKCKYTHYYKCKFWKETGRCENKEKEQCKYLHIALCKSNSCTDRGCKLTHTKGTLRNNDERKRKGAAGHNATSSNHIDYPFLKAKTTPWRQKDPMEQKDTMDRILLEISELKKQYVDIAQVQQLLLRQTQTERSFTQQTMSHQQTMNCEIQPPITGMIQ